MHIKKALNVLVVGQSAEALAVAEAFGKAQGVGMVRHAREADARGMAGFDAVVEMVGGVAPAFKVAMDALGQGMSLLTANPLLVAAHGKVLQNAAAGQHAYFGFQAAAFGVPLADVLAVMGLKKATVGWCTVANLALARMAYRNESLAQVSAQLKLQQADMSDWEGKVTQARALALRTLWQAEGLAASKQMRVGVEQVEIADMRRLREFGLQMVFGAEVSVDGLYVGPLAVTPESPLLAAAQQDVFLGEGEAGEIVLSCGAGVMLGGLLADLRQVVRSAKPAAEGQMAVYERRAPEDVRAYVRIAAESRDVVLAAKPEVVQERLSGDGLWQAVVAVKNLQVLQEVYTAGGMVYPLSGEWQPVSTGLRLVG
jgi:homoserine dehydrogenase